MARLDILDYKQRGRQQKLAAPLEYIEQIIDDRRDNEVNPGSGPIQGG